MVKRKFKIGDIVEVIHYTPARYAPGIKDELGTEALFRRMVGKRYRIVGFGEYGHIELHPTRRDWVWIEPGEVILAPKKRKRQGKVART